MIAVCASGCCFSREGAAGGWPARLAAAEARPIYVLGQSILRPTAGFTEIGMRNRPSMP